MTYAERTEDGVTFTVEAWPTARVAVTMSAIAAGEPPRSYLVRSVMTAEQAEKIGRFLLRAAARSRAPH